MSAMAYNFTDRVRKVLMIAREEAVRLRHGYVGAEHILLGLLREGESVAAAVLADLDVDVAGLGAQLEAKLQPGPPGRSVGPDLAYSSQAKKVLEDATAEARELGYSYFGTEHLLLGLLHCRSNPAADALAATGLTLERARASALRLRGPESARDAPIGARAGGAPNVRCPRAGVMVFAVVWLCFLGYGVVKLLATGPESYQGQRLFFLALPLGMLAELGARESPPGSTAQRVLRAAFLGLMLAGFLGVVL